MIIQQDPRELLIHQIKNFYNGGVETDPIDRALPIVLDKMEMCFSHLKNKYYHYNGETFFNPYHVCQWTMFLYEMAREIAKYGYVDLCNKLYGISKCFSSADFFYEIDLPDIYVFDHPQGSVMGRAKYGNFFAFGQGCTVGNNKGVFPTIGEYFLMFSGSKILGNCHVGDYVILSANCLVIDCDIPSYSIVFGSGRDIIIKPIDRNRYEELTDHVFDYQA